MGRLSGLAVLILGCLVAASPGQSAVRDRPPTKEEARRALLRAVHFFHTKVARQGGYLWQYSGDLTLREAEGRVKSETVVWVQPPGTPTIASAFLDAYEATGDKGCLDAARAAARTLVRGQMQTGGWAYSIEMDPEQRKEYGYRERPGAKVTRWKRATVLDDDTTAAALRFLMRLDRLDKFTDKKVHEAVKYALESVLLAQYPNGAWFGWWERYPKGFRVADYPVHKARYPADWARKPDRNWPARYILNDNVVPDMARTLLDAWEIYADRRYREAARKAGDFLLLAQMPQPQPAWAQQYDIDMQPCWGRKFEPPAISGAESQSVLEALLLLHGRTGDKKYLEAIPPALTYLKKSRLPNGKLARFYELKTNKPLYFTRKYELTYQDDDLPTHYRFHWDSRLDTIEAGYRRAVARASGKRVDLATPSAAELAAKARQVIAALDERGAWVEKGKLRFHRVAPPSGIIQCQTFADNVQLLCRFLATAR